MKRRDPASLKIFNTYPPDLIGLHCFSLVTIVPADARANMFQALFAPFFSAKVSVLGELRGWDLPHFHDVQKIATKDPLF